MTVIAEPEVVQVDSSQGGALEQQTRGEIDVQIATARRYPRSIRQFQSRALEYATLDEDTAASCFYALPRDGKTVEGPSARLAEIVASAWGHMRVEARVVDEDDRFVKARGMAWDIENNVAIAFEARRRITNRAGKTYSDDMIAVTANAASSIALRNAVFKVVPAALWRPIYLKCREVAVGNAETLVNRRAKMLEHFQKMGVIADKVFALLGVKGAEDITLDHMATLRGLATAIKDGDTTVDEAFSDAAHAPIKTPERKSAAAPVATPAAPEASTAAPSASPTPPATAPLTIVALIPQKRPGSTRICWKVALSDDSSAYFWDSPALMKDVHAAKELGVPVSLTFTGTEFSGAKEISGVTVLEGQA